MVLSSAQLLALAIMIAGVAAYPDPCHNYRTLNETHRSSSYVMEHHHTGLCDHELEEAWYRFTSAAGGRMPESCVDRFYCGTITPMWLHGRHPEMHEGVAERRACGNFGGSDWETKCCEHSVGIAVKNCGSYFVYFLRPPPSCPISYCAGDQLVCDKPGQGSANGVGPCEDLYPVADLHPKLSDPDVHGSAFRFHCDIDYYAHDPNLNLEVQFLFNGTADPAIPSKHLTGNDRRADLPGTAIKGHMGTKVSCRVRAWYGNKTTVLKGPWDYSNTYFAGFKVSPDHLTVSEKGDTGNVTVTSTIPILCNHDRACCLSLNLDTDGPKENVVMPHPCQHEICSTDWDPLSHTASTTIAVIAAKDNIRDGDKTMLLEIDNLLPAGGGPYLDVFTGYRPPHATVTVKDEATYSCSWNGDPHFHDFHGNRFNHYDVGDFTMFENKAEGFEVQSRLYRCGRVACQCGIVIREHSDVIRVDNCGYHQRRHVAPAVTTHSQPLRPGTRVERSRDGKTTMVYLPSGREVKIQAQGWYHNTFMTVPASDMFRGQGICGTLGSNPNNQLTHRDGTTETCLHGHTPQRFTQSWINHPSVSLFENKPADLNQQASHEPHYCQCDKDAQGVERINCTVGADVTHKAQRCSGGACQDVTTDIPAFLLGAGGGWTRRDVTYTDTDLPDPPVNLTQTSGDYLNVHWPTNGITEAEAKQTCRRAIVSSQLYSQCLHLHDLLNDHTEECMMDVLYMGGYDMAVESAVMGFTSRCQFSLMQDVNNYNVVNGKLVLKDTVKDVCSPECLLHGGCVRGECVCYPGWTGSNCQLVAGKPPTLGELRGPSDCDRSQRPCRTVFFEANHFEVTDHFKCKVDTLLPNGQPSGVSMEENATFLRGDRISCPLPDATGRSATQFSVTATTDGQHYSNAFRVTSYDSTCMVCVQHACTQKPNTCLIDNQCHQDNDHKTDDASKMCNTSSSVSQWTSINTGASFPNVSVPVLTGPDADFTLTCAVSSTSHAPSARFEVTWYADDVNPVGKETLLGDQRVAVINYFGLPANSRKIECRVRSFFDGSSDFSPYMPSGARLLQSA